MPKINQQDVVSRTGTSYPELFDRECAARQSLGLSDAGGLTQFGVHQVTLPPGCWASRAIGIAPKMSSSMSWLAPRHWSMRLGARNCSPAIVAATKLAKRMVII